MTDIGELPGIGKMSRKRLIDMNFATVEELTDYILSPETTDEDLIQLVDQIALNPRANVCLEGYYPRVHNKRIKDGLTAHILAYRPNFTIDDYRTVRAPESATGDDVIQCGIPAQEWGAAGTYVAHKKGAHHWGPYESFDGSSLSEATMQREGIAHRATPGVGYRYGKACIPDPEATRAERDMMIRSNNIYSNRQYYSCSCFRSKKTCEDFTEQRDNRRLDPTLSYCMWDGHICKDTKRRRHRKGSL